MKLLGQDEARRLDEELMNEHCFSIEQLMELAGLSVAQAVYDYNSTAASILVVCGPGNNGGDGLVAARHLVHFGYKHVGLLYPKRGKSELFTRLLRQCENVNVQVYDEWPKEVHFDLLIDAIFGFSFRGAPRDPYQNIIDQMNRSSIPIVSIDIPSGWDVEAGPGESGLQYPVVLISLTTPKKCAAQFSGIHYVGGRFLPPDLAHKYQITSLPYEGSSQICKISIGQC